MKIRRFLMTIAATVATLATMAQTDGFSYQAVVRDANGELINNSKVGLRLTLTDQTGEQVMYQETQTPTTNNYGVLNVTVGAGSHAEDQNLQNVNWASGDVWLRVEIDLNGSTNYTHMGTTKIQAVPVALYAARSGSSSQENGFQGNGVQNGATATADGDALFDVKDKDGNVVFAVYPEGVHVYIDPNAADGSKMKRSGFLVTGREASKDGVSNDYFAVNGAGTQVFVGDGDDKMKRSGFLVTGREASKEGKNSSYLSVNDEGTKVFIDDQLENDAKLKRSGFLVTGREASKGDTTNYLKVATDGTQVHFDNSAAKMKRSGFLVTGREASKGTAEEYMAINTDSTRFYINGAEGAKGFAVSGREDGAKDGDGSGSFGVSGRDGATSNLFNIDLTTSAETIDSVNRIYWYPAKNAFMAGNLKAEHPDSVGTNSFSAGFQNKAIGQYSQAMGYKSRAKGEYATAIGRNANADKDNTYAFGDSAQATGENAVAIGNTAIASGKNSYALGMNSSASGEGSYAFGEGAIASGAGSFAMGIAGTDWGGNLHNPPTASGKYSYAIGPGAVAKFDNSIAIGFGCTAEKENCLALGLGCNASGGNAVALGYANTASGNWSTALGRYSLAEGIYSIAMGFNARAKSHYEVVIGSYNTDYEVQSWQNNVNEPDGNLRAFTVANGYESWYGSCTITRSDAMVILKNGNTTINGILTANNVSASSDFRLKKDIQPLDGALDKVLKLRGVSFYWKSKEEMAAAKGKDVNNMSYGYSKDKQIGVIAQEIEEVLPELVVTDNEGFKSVKYENLTPVLIEAMKEQQAIIDAQNQKIESQQQQIDELKKMMEELLKK
ncbi:MAG: tail fiber domain-containing protein [Salinivirgaceae bacterium]|nr:tail fiber domain-containing protein [Salinivirgaceae bacterium]